MMNCLKIILGRCPFFDVAKVEVMLPKAVCWEGG